jgi:hypothetical protein
MYLPDVPDLVLKWKVSNAQVNFVMNLVVVRVMLVYKLQCSFLHDFQKCLWRICKPYGQFWTCIQPVIVIQLQTASVCCTDCNTCIRIESKNTHRKTDRLTD